MRYATRLASGGPSDPLRAALTGPAFQLLYLSELAPGCDFAAMTERGALARRHHHDRGVTGALLFDGERFGHLIEGDEAAVRALFAEIEADPRQRGLRILFEGVAAGGRLTGRLATGYCEPGELEAFDAGNALAGSAVLDVYAAVLARADVD